MVQSVCLGAGQMVTIEESKRKLRRLLVEKSFRYCTDPPFKLASGRASPYYIDCKPTTNGAEGLALVGEIFFALIEDLIQESKVRAIGGLSMGADPIAHATSMTSYLKGKPINSFCVRTSQKHHGIPKQIEGDVKPGDRVIIVDDVVTTGNSTKTAIERAREYGLEVVKVVVLVDRQEEKGRENIEKLVPHVEAVFTLDELMEEQRSANEGTGSGRASRRQSVAAN